MDVWLAVQRRLLAVIAVIAAACAPVAAAPLVEYRPAGVIAEFDIAKGGDVIILPVKIGKKQYAFALSTAGERTIFDKRLRPLLGDPVGRIDNSATPSEFEEFPPLSMKIGTESFTAQKPILCGDLTHLREYYGHEAYGIVGLDFLRGRIVQIDFDRGEFRVLSSFDDLDLPVSPASEPLLVDLYGSGGYTFALKLSGVDQFHLVDTLFARSLAVGPKLMDKLMQNDSVTDLQETSFFIAPGARFVMREGLLDRISCGRYTRQHVALLEQERNRVGLAYLSRFLVTFNFQKERIYLIPGARTDEDDVFTMHSGMELVLRDQKVTVLHAFPDYVAAKAGVKAGDVILQIDGRDADELTLFEIRKALGGKKNVQVKFRHPERGGQPASEYTVTLDSRKHSP